MVSVNKHGNANMLILHLTMQHYMLFFKTQSSIVYTIPHWFYLKNIRMPSANTRATSDNE